MAKIKVTKKKSAINRTKNQKLTLLALGLKKIGQTVELMPRQTSLVWLIKLNI